MQRDFPPRSYTFTLGANATTQLQVQGSYWKIISSTGTAHVQRTNGARFQNMSAGQGERNVEFDELLITDSSGASNTITILVGGNTYFDDRVTLTASSIDVRTAPLAISAGFNSTAVLAANTAEVIVAAAANVNGLIVQSANLMIPSALAGVSHIVAHTAAPASLAVGIPLLMLGNNAISSIVLPGPVRFPAGYGLYFIANGALAANDVRRAASYTLY